MKKLGMWIALGCICAAGAIFSPRLSDASSRAPDFTLYPSGGAVPVNLADLRGKVVVLDFWASWCVPCKLAIPDLEALHQQHARAGLVVLGITVNDKGDPVQNLKALGGSYPVLLQGEPVASDYAVTALPTVIVIGRDGNVLLRETGYSPLLAEKLREVVEAALEDQ